MNPPTTSSSGSGSQYYYNQMNNSTQWGKQETIELITIRGKLETKFSSCKRNKVLWETIASSLRDKGFFRSSHQCKSKWKNLVNRYKGKETSDPENGKQCPFFEELHAVFTERAENLQQSLMESQQAAVQSRKRMKSQSVDRFSNDFSQDDEDGGSDSDRDCLIGNNKIRKRKTDKEVHVPVNATDTNFSNVSSSSGGIQELLRGFFQQQQRIDMKWMESIDKHQREREMFEQEWRQSMEKQEKERLVMEQTWKEKEGQRKMKEEVRAEKQDALLTSLLNKLISIHNL